MFTDDNHQRPTDAAHPKQRIQDQRQCHAGRASDAADVDAATGARRPGAARHLPLGQGRRICKLCFFIHVYNILIFNKRQYLLNSRWFQSYLLYNTYMLNDWTKRL